MTNTPAGWFKDPENPGQMRYWDGSAWTEHRSPTQPVGVPSGGASHGAKTTDDRPWFKKKRFIIPLALVALMVVGGALGESSTTSTTSAASDATTTSDSATSEEPADVEEEGSDRPAPKPDSHEPTVSATAADMIKEFQDNELAADAKYKGKWVKVDGVINKIDTEPFNGKKYILQVGTGSEFDFLTVDCHDMPMNVLSTLTTGQSVSVVGEFDDGGDLGVEMKHCRLA